MQPRFLYFDLGKVLVEFDIGRMFAQLGEVAGIDPARVRQVVMEGGLQKQYETGRISTDEFHEAFCRQTHTRPDRDVLIHAGSDIFDLNLGMLPVVSQLQQAGYRLGILSNTCPSHWEYCRSCFRIVDEAFETHVLSCEVKAAKPDEAIFRAAVELAGVAPSDIFFVDDMPEHVAGAKAVGLDAVQYTSTAGLVGELRRRGVRFNVS
jgi:FMN phosphatase YigB (HAD superfamily)